MGVKILDKCDWTNKSDSRSFSMAERILFAPCCLGTMVKAFSPPESSSSLLELLSVVVQLLEVESPSR